MSLMEEIAALQRHLAEFAEMTDEDSIERYSLQWAPLPPGLYWRVRWRVAVPLRCLERMHLLRPDPSRFRHIRRRRRLQHLLRGAPVGRSYAFRPE